jgi:hypothetical protein
MVRGGLVEVIPRSKGVRGKVFLSLGLSCADGGCFAGSADVWGYFHFSGLGGVTMPGFGEVNRQCLWGV